jgi:hypothetical protein
MKDVSRLPSSLMARPSNSGGRIDAPLGQSAAQSSTWRSHGLFFFLVSSRKESAGIGLIVILKPGLLQVVLQLGADLRVRLVVGDAEHELAVADYAKLVPWWSDVVAGTQVQLYVGQADYKIATAGQPAAWFDPAEISRHLTFNESYNVSGDVHFSGVQVRADRLGAVTGYVTEHQSRPALIPTMSQLPSKPMMFPVITDADRSDSGAVSLGWRDTAQGVPFGETSSYAVYRFDGPVEADACGFADATHLIATVRRAGGREQAFLDATAEPGSSYTYYVTALDRLWNESAPGPASFVS